MNFELNTKQLQILEFLKEEIAIKGYPPTVREITDAVNLKSTSTVHSHLKKLEKLGYIKRDPEKPRAIEILELNQLEVNNLGFNQEIIELPLVKSIALDKYIFDDRNIEELIPLPANLVNGSNFLFRVNGDSMIKKGILNNDLVTIEKCKSPNNGDITLVLVHKEYPSIKTYFNMDEYIKLVPDNDFLEPITLNKKDVEVIGIVKGVIRKI